MNWTVKIKNDGGISGMHESKLVLVETDAKGFRVWAGGRDKGWFSTIDSAFTYVALRNPGTVKV